MDSRHDLDRKRCAWICQVQYYFPSRKSISYKKNTIILLATFSPFNQKESSVHQIRKYYSAQHVTVRLGASIQSSFSDDILLMYGWWRKSLPVFAVCSCCGGWYWYWISADLDRWFSYYYFNLYLELTLGDFVLDGITRRNNDYTVSIMLVYKFGQNIMTT